MKLPSVLQQLSRLRSQRMSHSHCKVSGSSARQFLPLFFPFFFNSLLLSLSFSPLLTLPLSPNLWRTQISKDWVLILGRAALSEGTGQGLSKAGSVAAGCQALASQAYLHYQALSEPNQGRTLQGRGDSSKDPVCSVGKSYCTSQGDGCEGTV